MKKDAIRVLVVDDSAFARRVMREVLGRDDRIEVVGIAHDGFDALEKIADLDPDVLTLDLVMPELDGAGLLEALRGRPNPPLAIIVSSTSAESDLGIAALEAGAFDVVQKPTALANDRMYELASELLLKVLAAGAARRSPFRQAVAAPKHLQRMEAVEVIVIGASTGGPRAIGELMRQMPRDFPIPIAIVLHMPAGYTEAFAQRLDERSSLHISEARDGELLRPGSAVVARAGQHLQLRKRGNEVATRYSISPEGALHRPSVDELFISAARAFGKNTLAIVLTGMGSDGLIGARAVKEAGGRVIVEDVSTCVVYGMPRSVVEAGLADSELPLPAIGTLLKSFGS